MKDKIRQLLRKTERSGIEALLDHMTTAGFFEAPCSTSFHLSKEGGLAEHSLNVCELMQTLWENTGSINDSAHGITPENIIIAGLLHDLGKASYRGKANYVPNVLKSGKLSDSKPFETNKSRLYVAHEVVSIITASQFIELTDEEEFAILYHNGLYVSSGRDIQGKERPLQQLLHFADMWCSRFVEVKGGAE